MARAARAPASALPAASPVARRAAPPSPSPRPAGRGTRSDRALDVVPPTPRTQGRAPLRARPPLPSPRRAPAPPAPRAHPGGRRLRPRIPPDRARSVRASGSPSGRCERRRRDLRVRIDERHVEPGPFSRRDEEELIALGELALDDRGRDPVSRCCSTARFSGRAPSSALKPSSIRKSIAASSHSTAHGRIRKPRRPSTSFSSFSSRLRMISRPSGRKTTTRSRRLRNSGRNERATDLTHVRASNLPATCR